MLVWQLIYSILSGDMYTVTHMIVIVKPKKNTHREREREREIFVCRGSLIDGTCGFLRGVRSKCGSQEPFFNNK